MIIAKNLKSVYDSHKEELLKLYLAEKNTPLTHQDLELCFTDSEGKNYFRFPKQFGLPIDRLGKLMLYQQFLAKGLSPENDIEYDEIIRKATLEGIKTPQSKWASVIISTLEEKDKCRKTCIHEELFFQCLAVQWVREDEPVDKFVVGIHLEKVDQFMAERLSKNRWFFFHQPELEKLRTLLNLTEENIDQLLDDSKVQVELAKQKLNYLKTLKVT